MTNTVVTYIRGKSMIQCVDKKATEAAAKSGDKNAKKQIAMAHGLVGELWVHGYCFDTIERMDGMVSMDECDNYFNSSIYWHPNYDSYVVNPWLGMKAEKTKKGEILFHPAGVPSDLLGCVGVGFLEGQLLTLTRESLSVLWDQCGGRPNDKKNPVTITLRVQGQMRDWRTCPMYSGG